MNLANNLYEGIIYGMVTLKQHLKIAREKAHETQRKNGHYNKMAEAKKIKKNKS